MKFIDLFSGIGAFRAGLESLGHECVGFVECNPYCSHCQTLTANQIHPTKRNVTVCATCQKEVTQHARIAYENMFTTNGEWNGYDITTITNDDIRLLGNTLRRRFHKDEGKSAVDLLVGGFPCNAFSHAGKRGGFSDPRGRLVFELFRFLPILKPHYFILENVTGLLTHNHGRTFGILLSEMGKLGYDVQWQICDAFIHGETPVPQNRSRLFLVGHLAENVRRPEIFPLTPSPRASSKRVISVGNIRKKGKSQSGMIYDAEGLAPTLTATGHSKDPVKVRIPTNNPEDPYVYRRLTSLEHWRLQGFSDELYLKAAEVLSESKLNFVIGNSIPIPIIVEIGKKFPR